MFSNLQRLFFFILLALTMTVFTACSDTPEGNPTDGKRWYAMHNCSACHGENGNDGDAIAVNNLDMSFNAFVSKLRTTDAPIMPHFPEEKINKQDAADIYSFLTSEP